MDTVNSPVMPSEDGLTVQSNSKSWRPAKGMFVRGQEIKQDVQVGDTIVKDFETGHYPEEKAAITGILRRVGIYKNPSGKFGPEHKLECDIDTADGLVHLGVGLLATDGSFKVGIAALNLAWCLLQYNKDGMIRLATALGDPIKLPNGKDGGRPTYINAYRVEFKDGKTIATPIYRPKRDVNEPKQTMENQWVDLEAQLREHGAFADREVPVDEGSHLAALIVECQAKGFPSVTENDLGYARFLSALYNDGLTPTGLAFYPDDKIGRFRLDLSEVTVLTPGALKIIEDAKQPSPVNAGLLG